MTKMCYSPDSLEIVVAVFTNNSNTVSWSDFSFELTSQLLDFVMGFKCVRNNRLFIRCFLWSVVNWVNFFLLLQISMYFLEAKSFYSQQKAEFYVLLYVLRYSFSLCTAQNLLSPVHIGCEKQHILNQRMGSCTLIAVHSWDETDFLS